MPRLQGIWARSSSLKSPSKFPCKPALSIELTALSWAFPPLSTWWTLSLGGDACADSFRQGSWDLELFLECLRPCWCCCCELGLPRSCSGALSASGHSDTVWGSSLRGVQGVLWGGQCRAGPCQGVPPTPRACCLSPALLPAVPTVLKKRLVKLVVNFLFYFRTDEAEPIGALLLEHCKITKEEDNVFSISFIEEPERKYCFECATEEQCQEWVEALKRASYEFLRRSLIFYRNEIQKMTGKDPLEQYGISEEARFQLGAHRQ
ncbi:pleckstrin homology domain-containing family J member 1 [Cyanistes caeruleus]|nr:pleckstrin homology domain-containing family J member 1 [Cyanistes caeruleus]